MRNNRRWRKVNSTCTYSSGFRQHRLLKKAGCSSIFMLYVTFDLSLYALLLFEPVLYSLRVQGLLFLFRLPMSCTIPSEMFRPMHHCKLWKGGKEWLGIKGFDRTERHLADSSTSRRSVITPRTSSNCL